jgi:hypothetical protein
MLWFKMYQLSPVHEDGISGSRTPGQGDDDPEFGSLALSEVYVDCSLTYILLEFDPYLATAKPRLKSFGGSDDIEDTQSDFGGCRKAS